MSSGIVSRLLELRPVNEEEWRPYLAALVAVQQCILPLHSQAGDTNGFFLYKICVKTYQKVFFPFLVIKKKRIFRTVYTANQIVNF